MLSRDVIVRCYLCVRFSLRVFFEMPSTVTIVCACDVNIFDTQNEVTGKEVYVTFSLDMFMSYPQ